MPHDKGPSRASRCPHKTIAAFDLAPHNVGNSRALVDAIHPWIYCENACNGVLLLNLGLRLVKAMTPQVISRWDCQQKGTRSDDRK
jgi:hypothetical protein